MNDPSHVKWHCFSFSVGRITGTWDTFMWLVNDKQIWHQRKFIGHSIKIKFGIQKRLNQRSIFGNNMQPKLRIALHFICVCLLFCHAKFWLQHVDCLWINILNGYFNLTISVSSHLFSAIHKFNSIILIPYKVVTIYGVSSATNANAHLNE